MKVAETVVKSATDALKLISDRDRVLLYECCADNETDDFEDWWKLNENEKLRKAVLNMRNREGQTLLHVACNFGQYEIVCHLIKLYLKYDIKIDKLFDKYHDTPFTLACQRGYSKFEEDSVKFDPETKTERSARYKICSQFVDQGITINMDDVIKAKKNSPLHWAIYHGDYATSL